MSLDAERIRTMLTERREALSRRARHLQSDRRHERAALDPDSGEQAVERENDEVLDGLDTHVRAEIESIDRTLARIAAGTFGTCASCASPVDGRRLEALPTAELCLACAE